MNTITPETAKRERLDAEYREYLAHHEPHILDRICPACGNRGPKVRVSYREICESCASDKDETIALLLDEVERLRR